MVSDRLIILGLSSVKDVATPMDMGPAFHFLASFCMSSSFSTADLNERHNNLLLIETSSTAVEMSVGARDGACEPQ